MRAGVATGEERERLWQRWRTVDPDLDDFAALRSVETPVLVLEPRRHDGDEVEPIGTPEPPEEAVPWRRERPRLGRMARSA